MKKHMNILIFGLLFFMTGCTTARLVDKTSNDFFIKATQGDFEDKVEISWIDNSFYSKYVIYRSESEYGEYIKISDGIKDVKYTDTSIQSGKEYYYQVEGYNQVNYPFYVSMPTVGFAGAEGGFFPPQFVTVHSGEFTDRLKVSWSRVEGATHYEVWKSEDNVNFNFVAKVSHQHYVDINVESGKCYYYQINSLKNTISSPNRSLSQKGHVFGGDIQAQASSGLFSDKIVISWSKIPYAEIYHIFRSENNSSKGVKIAEQKQDQNSTYADTSIEKGKIYFYTIQYRNNTAASDSSQVRGYATTLDSPGKPNNFTVSQGTVQDDVQISWNAVDKATTYDLERAKAATGPWSVIYSGSDIQYTDTPDKNHYTYYYRVIPKNNSVLGEVSEVKAGWGLNPPINIKASQNLSTKIEIIWDKVPEVMEYEIYYSDSSSGVYNLLDKVSSQYNKYSYTTSAEGLPQKSVFFKIKIKNSYGSSKFSDVIEGIVKNIYPPTYVLIVDNKKPTKTMVLSWDRIPNVPKYAVYRAVLAHAGADPSKIKEADYKKIAEVQNNSYTISCSIYPIRRSLYQIKSLDGNDVESATGAKLKEIVWRLPVDTVDFLKDVDVTILEAQTRVPNFGALGSAAIISARYTGKYDYSAAIGNIKNHWQDYVSFEIKLTGNPKMSISLSPMGSYMDGDVNVSGIYSGKVTYHRLLGILGGYSTRGSVSAEYNHPTQGILSTNLNLNEAGILLNSVVLESEPKPSKPSFEAGAGV